MKKLINFGIILILLTVFCGEGWGATGAKNFTVQPDVLAPTIDWYQASTYAFRPLYVDKNGYIWGRQQAGGTSLKRASQSDLSDLATKVSGVGSVSWSWESMVPIDAAETKFAIYVYTSAANRATYAGFYIIDNSNPASVTKSARKAEAFPDGDATAGGLTNMASARDGLHLWACSYGTKSCTDPPYYIYRSVDGGETWEDVYHHIVAYNTHMHCLAWDSYRNRIWACIGDLGSGGRPGILYSDNYGASDSWVFVEQEEVGGDGYMLTSIVPLPDEVLFGTDRAPAGVLNWKPTGTNALLAQPVVLEEDITQVYYAQEAGSNLGFSGIPIVLTDKEPYRILFPFGYNASYSDAWGLMCFDGSDNMFNLWTTTDSDTNKQWIRYFAGVTSDGYAIGGTSFTGDAYEWTARIKVPKWAYAAKESSKTYSCGVVAPEINNMTGVVVDTGLTDVVLANLTCVSTSVGVTLNSNASIYNSIFHDCVTDIDDNGFTATESHNIFSTGLDPAFISTSDLRLRAGSPCINAGTDVWTGTASITDYAGTQITNAAGVLVAPGGKVDIGAYEYRPSINNAARFLLLFD